MTLTATPSWTPEGKRATSVPARDFFSGDIAVSSQTYDQDIKFGFLANELFIENTGAEILVFQWLERKGEQNGGNDVDSGVVEAGTTKKWNSANKTGLRLRNEGTATNARLTATA